MSKINKLKNKCRTCFSSCKGLQQLAKMINENKEGAKSYGELLKDLTQIDIMDEAFNEMPQAICSCCIRKLKAAHAFVQQAHEVNDKLWCMISTTTDSVNEDKPIDCPQEAQIDIKNCLEIKTEDDKADETNNKQELTKFDIKLKLEESEGGNGVSYTSADKISSAKKVETKETIDLKDILETTIVHKPNEPMSESEDDFLKTDEEMTGSEFESVTSNDSDWAKEITAANSNDNKDPRGKTKARSKKAKEKQIDDNIATPCGLCDKVFLNSRLLSRHKRHTHVPEELKEQCPYCTAKFGRRHNMYAHMRTHHKDKPIDEHITQQRKLPRQYACEQCGGTYTSKYHLLAHMKRKHNPDSAPKKPERVILPKKRFLCTLCGSKFASQPNLKVHIKRHTGEKPFKCDFCERAYYRPCDMQAHRRSHTGEKPFKCTICKKGFARSNKLTVHLRTHSNERPYKCDECEKAFKQSKDLVIHRRKHTGERPYVCGVCHSTFTQSNSLKHHQTKQQHFVVNQVVRPPLSKIISHQW